MSNQIQAIAPTAAVIVQPGQAVIYADAAGNLSHQPAENQSQPSATTDTTGQPAFTDRNARDEFYRNRALDNNKADGKKTPTIEMSASSLFALRMMFRLADGVTSLFRALRNMLALFALVALLGFLIGFLAA